MLFRRTVALAAAALLAAGPSFSNENDKKSAKPAEASAGWTESQMDQPATESLDLGMYNAIRDEGLEHSHVMDYAGGLIDGIGPRLTGSPNMAKANAWTRDQLTKMGCVNAHLEDWGEFGMGWQQLNTWVRMVEPDTAIFVAQATPWSPSSNGPVKAEAISVVINDESDLAKYKGKLGGKIVLLGAMREVPSTDKPFFERYDEKELKELEAYPLENANADMQARIERYMKRIMLTRKILPFLSEEKPAGVIVPSRDGKNGGGTGIIFDDNGAALGRTPYHRDTAVPFPVVVTQIESYGRVFRLLKHNVPVTIEMNVETKFTGDHEHGFNTVAEIPGTDPKLKDEIVMVGGHLDSWIAGTGATDNGAGSIVALEVMRILTSLKAKPRRTIRIALWSGEEEGLFGSKGYANAAFRQLPALDRSRSDEHARIPPQARRPYRSQARAKNGLRLFQRGQRHRQNPRHLHAEQRHRLRHLQTMDGTARRPRRHHDHESKHRRHRPSFLRRRRRPRLPIHSGRRRLRDAHAPLQHGHLRASRARRPEADRHRRSHLRLQRRDARQNDPAQTVPASRAARPAKRPAPGFVSDSNSRRR